MVDLNFCYDNFLDSSATYAFASMRDFRVAKDLVNLSRSVCFCGQYPQIEFQYTAQQKQDHDNEDPRVVFINELPMVKHILNSILYLYFISHIVLRLLHNADLDYSQDNINTLKSEAFAVLGKFGPIRDVLVNSKLHSLDPFASF